MLSVLKNHSFNAADAAKSSGESFAARCDLVIVGGIALAVSLIFVDLISIIAVVAILSIRLSVAVLGLENKKVLKGSSL